MMVDLSPLSLLLVTLAGWVNRHQQQVIEYLVEENRVLKEQLEFSDTTPSTMVGRQGLEPWTC